MLLGSDATRCRPGTSLLVHLLRLCSSSAGYTGSMPARRTKIPYAAQCSQKLKNKKKQARIHPSKERTVWVLWKKTLQSTSNYWHFKKIDSGAVFWGDMPETTLGVLAGWVKISRTLFQLRSRRLHVVVNPRPTRTRIIYSTEQTDKGKLIGYLEYCWFLKIAPFSGSIRKLFLFPFTFLKPTTI